MERRELAVGANRHVGDGRGAVAAHALAPKTLQANGELLVDERTAEASANAGANFLIVIRRPAGECAVQVVIAGVRGRDSRSGGIDAVTEGALDAEHLPVAPARLNGHLDDESGSVVEGVVARRYPWSGWRAL